MKALTKNEKILAGVGTGALLIGGILLYRSIRNKGAKADRNFDKSTVGSFNIVEVARQIGMDLGTAYGIYDPRRWTENDAAVKKILLQFPVSLIPFLKIEYSRLYKRSLQEDLQKLLDDYPSVRHLFI